MATTLIKDGTIITASHSFAADLVIKDERIEQIGRNLLVKDVDREIDAAGKYIMPGGIDVHTHLDMPVGDFRSVDTFETGTIAAACGGTTTIIDYAAHEHGELMARGLETWHRRAEGRAVIDYGFHMTLSEFTERTLRDMEQMVNAGVSSFKVFTAYPGRMMLNDASILKILKRSEELGTLVCVHAENGHVIDVLIQEALESGNVAPKYHAITRPSKGEGEAVNRVITLAELAETHLYIVHVSCCEAVEHITRARLKGLPIYAETCPQYLFLSDEYYELPDFKGAKYVMSPPLRDKQHQDGIWHGIQNRMLQVVGTDHCPFHFHGQKDRNQDNFTQIPNGGPGIETRLSLLYTGGVCTGRISLNHFVDLVSTAPARLFGLYPKKGAVAPGSDADLMIVDPRKETVISAATHHSAVDYSLYEGMKVKGVPDCVFSRGKMIIDHGDFIGTPGDGQFIPRPPQSSFPDAD